MLSRGWESARRRPLVSAAVAFLLLRFVDLIAFWLVAQARGITLRKQLLSWDAGWLLNTALHGWPTEIPVAADGTPEQTSWPWPAVVPLLARSVGKILGEAWAGPGLIFFNGVGGLAAAVFLCAMLLSSLGVDRALGASIVWSALPAAPVYLMGYADGVFTALAFAGLWALIRYRFVLAGLLLVAAGLTKLNVAPFAVTLALTVLVLRVRPGPHRPSWPRVVAAIGLAGMAVAAWPTYVAVRLGSWNAYSFAHSAWGRSEVPFADAWRWLVSSVTAPSLNTWVGVVVMAAYLAAAVAVARDGVYPVAFRILAVVAPVFILAVGPTLSTARDMQSDPALATAVRAWAPRARTFAAVVALLALLGVGWIVLYPGAEPGSPPP